MTERIPALILGGTGYVAGEVLRLVLGHPHFALAGLMSDSQPGEPVGNSSPQRRTASARR
jgi:N-acetyl-gamma-glutamylphosphate reductase